MSPSNTAGNERDEVSVDGQDPLGVHLDATGQRQVSLSDLEIDTQIQQRVDHLNQDTLKQYLEDAEESWPFPPVTVYVDEGGKYWLADGFHRVEVAKQLGHEKVPCDVRTGSRRDALLHACGANARHGYRRTRADAQRAIRTLLEDPEWSQWSDHDIARQCGVNQSTVSRHRGRITDAMHQSDGATPAGSEHTGSKLRKTADGRTMNVAPISKANRARGASATSGTKPSKDTPEADIEKSNKFFAELRRDDFIERDYRRLAEHARDLLIWCLKKLSFKDRQGILEKITENVEKLRDSQVTDPLSGSGSTGLREAP